MKRKVHIPEAVDYHRAAGSLHPDPSEFLFQEMEARRAANPKTPTPRGSSFARKVFLFFLFFAALTLLKFLGG